MILFINAVSSNGVIILLDNKKNIIDSESISILGHESMMFINLVDNFLKKNNIVYTEIENIIFVNGPGSFTGVRTVTLVINTLAFIFKNIKITPIGFFDLFSRYPIVKPSSKRDLFVKKSKYDTIEIIQNEDFLDFLQINSISTLYGESLLDLNVETIVDYKAIIEEIKFENFSKIEPLYIKKPSIS